MSLKLFPITITVEKNNIFTTNVEEVLNLKDYEIFNLNNDKLISLRFKNTNMIDNGIIDIYSTICRPIKTIILRNFERNSDGIDDFEYMFLTLSHNTPNWYKNYYS